MTMRGLMWATVCVVALAESAGATTWKTCDFSQLRVSTPDSSAALCRYRLGVNVGIKVTCPRQFKLLPLNDMAADQDSAVAYVARGAAPVQQPLNRIILPPEDHQLIAFHRDGHGGTVVKLRSPHSGHLIQRGENVIYFICASQNIRIDGELALEIAALGTDGEEMAPTWMRGRLGSMPAARGVVIGVVAIGLQGMLKATHGCGSTPTNFFLNDVQHDAATGVRSCTIDVMEHPDVAFICDGLVEPDTCFERLLNPVGTHNEVLIANLQTKRDTAYNGGIVANVARTTLLRHFSGECRCRDRGARQLKAIVSLKTGKHYVCDIPAMLFRNHVQPIAGNWCDVALMPGGTLTIKMPLIVNGSLGYGIDGEDDGTYPPGLSLRLPPGAAQAGLVPLDIERRFLGNIVDRRQGLRHEERVVDHFLGDALQVDRSREDQGVVTLRYLEGPPFAHKGSMADMHYLWYLRFDRGLVSVPDVAATIRLTMTPNYDRTQIACEPPNAPIYKQHEPSAKNVIKELRIAGGNMRLCDRALGDLNKFIIYCPQGQTLEPRGCRSVGYDAARRHVVRWPSHLESGQHASVNNMSVFERRSTEASTPFSVSCSCIDESGRETARMVVHNEIQMAGCGRMPGVVATQIMIIPTVRMIRINIGHHAEPEIREIPLAERLREATCEVPAGYEMVFECHDRKELNRAKLVPLEGINAPIMRPQNYTIDGSRKRRAGEFREPVDRSPRFHTRWFPVNCTDICYRKATRQGKPYLLPTRLQELLGTNAQGFRVVACALNGNGDNNTKIRFVNPIGAIVVSKTNAKSVILTYVCGKISEVTGRHARNGCQATVSSVQQPPPGDGDLKHPPNNARCYDQVAGSDIDLNNAAHVGEESVPPLKRGHMDQCASMELWETVDVVLPTTDPYLHGCGVVDSSEGVFRQDTEQLLDKHGEVVGCSVNLATHGMAAFYCPLPYKTDPVGCVHSHNPMTSHDCQPNVQNPGGRSSLHFHIFRAIKTNEPRSQICGTGPYECRCVNKSGVAVSTINLTNYYL